MTTTKKRRSYINMMLAQSYCEDWGVAEVLREIVSNAIDADPHHTVTFSDEVTVETVTNPSIGNLLMMGSGSKKDQDENIGQFGEGLKVAALTATRLKMNMQIETPHGLITFVFRRPDGFDEDCLHACLNTNVRHTGCRISFQNSDGVKDLYDSMFLQGTQNFGPICEAAPGTCRIFSKNVLICKLSETALYDWNLERLKINRDRSIPDSYSVKTNIMNWLAKNGKDEHFDKIITHSDCYEAQCLRDTWAPSSLRSQLKAAFVRVHGEKAILAVDNQHANTLASYKGHIVVSASMTIKDLLEEYVQNSNTVLTMSDTYKTKPLGEGTKQDMIRKFADIIGCSAPIVVFEPVNPEDKLGYYESTTDTIGLSSILFQAGNQQTLFGTYIHEAAHWRSQGTDATIIFEHALTEYAGLLCVTMLPHLKD